MKTSLSPVQTRLATNSYCDEQTTAARSIRRHAVADDRVSMIPPGTRKEQITRRNKETRINGGVSSKPDWAAQYELGLEWNRILFWFFFSYQSIELHRTFDPFSIPSNRTDSDRIVQNTNGKWKFSDRFARVPKSSRKWQNNVMWRAISSWSIFQWRQIHCRRPTAMNVRVRSVARVYTV